jgi:oxaloacetate decarboxylase alpha subunit
MAHIEIIDQTLRDGQQSLWGMQMRAGMALPATPLIDRVGYEVVDLVGSSMFEIMVRNFAEDPWEGLDLIVASMPRSRIRAAMRNTGIISMSVTPDCLMDLWVRRLCEHGVRSFWIYDVLHWNVDKTHRLARIAKAYGAEVVAALMYTLSPVHTDEFYAQKAHLLGDSPDVDRLIIYDTAGVLTPDRARSLIPAIRGRCRGKTLEIHSHNVVGLTPLLYLEAIEQGVTILHTCTRPLANGSSLPSVEMTLRNIELAGHTHRLDKALLPPIAEHFERVGRTAGYALGVMNEYDLWVFEHQVPGGMTGTLRNQLAQHGMAHKLDQVLHEVAAVRRDLGYPGMATPFSQLVGVLAVMNVVNGERYRTIPDEVIQYACGYYGQPVAPIDTNVLDRIMSAPRAAEIQANPPPQPTLEELRAQFGGVGDDELILRYLIAVPFIEKMKAAGPVPRDYPVMRDPNLERARALMTATTARYLEIASNGLELELGR